MSSSWSNAGRLWISYVRVGSASSWGLVQFFKKSSSDKNEGTNEVLVSTEVNEVRLPKDVNELLKNHFRNKTIPEIIEMIRNPSRLSSAESLLLKYSGGALLAGRPMDSVVIFMAGSSGTGKSSTINALFEDNSLCKTSSTNSQTTDPVLVQKILCVSDEKPSVKGYLSFVDIPGTFDTSASNETANLASIRKFIQERIELAPRDNLLKSVRVSEMLSLRRQVYPNLVLFVVNAGDDRMVGPDSILVKTLKLCSETGDLIDLEKPNVIVVLTHAIALGLDKECYEESLKEKVKVIGDLFYEHLKISTLEVVAVENNPKKFKLEMEGGFCVLPNGEKSHLNLFHAMLRRLDANKDLLGRLFVSWYFGSDCPEKKEKAEVIKSSQKVDKADLEAAAQLQRKLNIQLNDQTLVPTYNFQSLGCGFCPVTEEIKPVTPLGSLGTLKTVEINHAKFQIPEGVTPYVSNMSRFHQMSFYDKEEYQSFMEKSYGIEAGLKLVVRGSSDGRWMEKNSSSMSHSSFSLIQESQVACFKLSNPSERQLDKGFSNDLNRLPNEYSDNTVEEYRSFFSKWGTHFIHEQSVGGAMHLKCTVQEMALSREKLQKITAQVSTAFKEVCGWGGGASCKDSQGKKGLRSLGIRDEHLQIDGGNSPNWTTLEAISKEALTKWFESVAGRPAELRHTIKLYPYYNFLESGSAKNKSLRNATEEYLSGRLNKRIKTKEEERSRNEIARMEWKKAVETRKTGWCTFL